MKKLVIGLSVMVLTTFATANEVTAKYEGRYAKDCSKKHAHKLSYVISDTNLVRLINAQEKYADFVETHSDLVSLSGYQSLTSKTYGDFKVDFYQKDEENWAKVHYLGNDPQEKKAKYLFMQCINPNLISIS